MSLSRRHASIARRLEHWLADVDGKPAYHVATAEHPTVHTLTSRDELAGSLTL